MRTRPPTQSDLAAFLHEGETVRHVFMACDYNTTAIDGGSTRIIAVTDPWIVVLFGGIWHRTVPQKLAERRRPTDLRDPEVVWPGTSPYGEEWGQVMSGLWAHVRYRDVVERARTRILWLYS